MSELRRQNYANHRLRLKPAFALAGLLLFAGFVMFVWTVSHDWSPVPIAGCILGLGGLVLWFSVRMADIRLQDRVIRAEMRARFERVLGAARAGELERLTLRQTIALRFASDAELPALASEALAHPELTGEELKQRVRDWQADHLRV